MNLVDTKTIIFRSCIFQIPKSCSWVAANPDGMVYAYKSEPVWREDDACWNDISEKDERIIGILSDKPIGIALARSSKLDVFSSNSSIEWLQLAAVINYLHHKGRISEAREFVVYNVRASWFPKDADAFIKHSGVESAMDTCILIQDVISKASAKQVEYGNRVISVPCDTRYLAMQENGVLYAFSEKPHFNHDEWRGKGKLPVSWLSISDDDFSSVENSLLKVRP